MPVENGPSLGRQLTWAGAFTLTLAAGLTGVSCTLDPFTPFPTTTALILGALLWLLAACTMIVGLLVRQYERRSSVAVVRVVRPAAAKRPRAYSVEETSPTRFGKRTMTSPYEPTLPPPAKPEWLDGQFRHEQSRATQGFLVGQQLDRALDRIESMISETGDLSLVQAAAEARGAEVDWTEICCEAIEADIRLKSLEFDGCRVAQFELGDHRENRLRFTRHYYGPPAEEYGAWDQPKSRLGTFHGLLAEHLEVAALAQLTLIVAGSWPADKDGMAARYQREFLASHLLVLRFFDAVQQAATERGMPMPVRFDVRVQRSSGDAAISSLEPNLAMLVDCTVQPCDDRVARRLDERHIIHLNQWDEDTDRLIENLSKDYDANGWVPSRYVPDELEEDKRKLRSLEDGLLVHDPRFRLSPIEVASLCNRIRVVREENRPQRIDPNSYR